MFTNIKNKKKLFYSSLSIVILSILIIYLVLFNHTINDETHITPEICYINEVPESEPSLCGISVKQLFLASMVITATSVIMVIISNMK